MFNFSISIKPSNISINLFEGKHKFNLIPDLNDLNDLSHYNLYNILYKTLKLNFCIIFLFLIIKLLFKLKEVLKNNLKI